MHLKSFIKEKKNTGKEKGCHIGTDDRILSSTANETFDLRKVLSADYGLTMDTTSTKR